MTEVLCNAYFSRMKFLWNQIVDDLLIGHVILIFWCSGHDLHGLHGLHGLHDLGIWTFLSDRDLLILVTSNGLDL